MILLYHIISGLSISFIYFFHLTINSKDKNESSGDDRKFKNDDVYV